MSDPSGRVPRASGRLQSFTERRPRSPARVRVQNDAGSCVELDADALLFARQKRSHTTERITRVTGLYGGVFDPPHNGHRALARAALEHFDLQQLLVLVVVDPGHKSVELEFEQRFRLTRLAFEGLPRTEIHPEGHARTVDALRKHHFADSLFLIGADEFAAFSTWKEPDEVLRLARLGVATRPGYSREPLEAVLAQLERPDRVEFFEIPAVEVSSSEIRERVLEGAPIDGLVPDAVAREIESAGLYRCYPDSK